MKPTSEYLVEDANAHYLHTNEAKVKKCDARIRMVNGQVFHASSTGLDYAGLLYGGKHLEFEVKETIEQSLHTNNIRISQIDRMRDLDLTGAETFLLVYFSKLNEWYKIYFRHLEKVLSYSSIPVEYFRAFGYIVDNTHSYPEYLKHRDHDDKQKLQNKYPSYMPSFKQSRERKVVTEPPRDYTDTNKTKQRILEAIEKGCKNAQKKIKSKMKYMKIPGEEI